jgi:hypothetical protein
LGFRFDWFGALELSWLFYPAFWPRKKLGESGYDGIETKSSFGFAQDDN